MNAWWIIVAFVTVAAAVICGIAKVISDKEKRREKVKALSPRDEWRYRNGGID